MAKIVIDGLADDLDGTPQWVRPVTTHTFSLDGVDREIDLHDEHAGQMMADFAKWINASRQIGKTPSTAVPHITPATPRQVAETKKSKVKPKKGHRDPAQILAEKQWLRTQGYNVSKFGKTPDDLQAKYQDHLRNLMKGNNNGFAAPPSEADRLFLAAAASG